MMKKSIRVIHNRKVMLGILFILPWIVGFLVFTIYPIVYSLYLSLQSVKITAHGIVTTYNGFANYQRAFVIDRVMINYLLTFLWDSIFKIIVINVFALIFALILNTRIIGRGIYRVIFFLPVVIASGPVITELVNQNILVIPGIENFAVIEMFSQFFGMGFGKLIVNIFSDLIYMFWFSGVQIIVFLAVLQKMNPDIYEAAGIDGASSWDSFWKITLPALKPVILINIIYTFIMLATFADNPVIIEIKAKMISVVSEEGYGYASALAWIYFIALMLVVAAFFGIFMIRRGSQPKVSFYAEGYVYNTTRYEYKDTFFNTNKLMIKAKKRLVGSSANNGLIMRAFVYLLITVVAFSYLYPFIYLILKSFHSPQDVIDPTIGLIPSGLYMGNFERGFRVIGFWSALKESLKVSLLPSFAQVVSTSVIGYGLSRYNFKGKKIIIVLILFTFIIPPQVLMIPTYIFYVDLGIIGNVLSFILPSLFGQGIKSAIFIMIFYHFFNMIPKVLDEAAEIDGASPFKIFYRIALPLAIPAVIVVFLFSFVWYWNETYLTSLYLPDSNTLPRQLSVYAKSFRSLYPDTGNQASDYIDHLNEAAYMAGTLISILPLLFIYFILQRWFVEGVDRTGIAGE